MSLDPAGKVSAVAIEELILICGATEAEECNDRLAWIPL
jgi:hypothetical protein